MKYNTEELKRARDEFTIAAQWCNDILSGDKKSTRANIEGCLHSADRTAGEGIRRLSHVLPDDLVTVTPLLSPPPPRRKRKR